MLRRTLFQASSLLAGFSADKLRDGGIAAHGVALVKIGKRRFGQYEAARFNHAAIMRGAEFYSSIPSAFSDPRLQLD